MYCTVYHRRSAPSGFTNCSHVPNPGARSQVEFDVDSDDKGRQKAINVKSLGAPAGGRGRGRGRGARLLCLCLDARTIYLGLSLETVSSALHGVAMVW